MSAMHRIISVFSLALPGPCHRTSSAFLKSRTFFASARLLAPCPVCSHHSIMPRNQTKAKHGREQKWKHMSKPAKTRQIESALTSEAVTDSLGELSIAEHNGEAHMLLPIGNPLGNTPHGHGQTVVSKPRAYGTVSGSSPVESESIAVGNGLVERSRATSSVQDISVGLSRLFKPNYLENFSVDNSTYTSAQIRATFYPKFENEKSDQEIRIRMIEMVSTGLATLEVSLKHSGSLFMYAGHEGGAYAKNSFGNIYTAVGTFVLGRMFRESWGKDAEKKQLEFNKYLEQNRMCISMELVTAVLGDHGQRPKEDYEVDLENFMNPIQGDTLIISDQGDTLSEQMVVTAITELGRGKPNFYSTPEVVAFCRKWRLPTNHVWLFSTRKSVTSFFAAFDALCEEGTATPVCKALDEVADISVPGSKNHIDVQGEILEGLVARVVSHDSSRQIEEVLKEFPPTPSEAHLDLGPSLRDICAANRSDEKQQIKALLNSVGSSFCPDLLDWLKNESGDDHSRNADKSVVSKFLQSRPADHSTTKLQEMIRLMREKRLPAAFKCYHNLHKIDSASSDNLFYRMVIHVRSDSAFRRYQKEMRYTPGLWPLYRGFFVDINLFQSNKERAAEISKRSQDIDESINGDDGTSSKDGLADDDANLMIKLKFLTYKLRTFLIRNGLSILFKEGPAAYKTYYLRQMRSWGTSPGKQRELSKMLDEWATYVRRKCGNKQLSSSIYLSEAEPFLEQYAKRSPANQALIGSAGIFVRSEDFLAIVDGGRDEEGDLEREQDMALTSPSVSGRDSITKTDGLIVFFPGIPGCAKSALCKELLSAGGFEDDRPVHTLMGDLIKGRYWQKVADERRRNPKSIMLADKNAPNEEVWRQIEDMCRTTRASAVPVIPDSEGTYSNPFSLDALAVFMFRVLQRVNHPGNLDKASPNAGYVLLMFYQLYEGKGRQEFETELIERFGSLVKMPLLKTERSPLPDSVKAILEEGIDLYRLHTSRHGRLESTKGSYAKEWTKWEKQIRDILSSNSEYLNSIQVPFDFAVKQVSEQLNNIVSGDYTAPSTERRKLGSIVFAAVSLPISQIQKVLQNMAEKSPKIEAFLKDDDVENNLKKAHVTLAHKRSHGVTAVASYGMFLNREVPVDITALLYNEKMAAFEVQLGCVDGETVTSKNEWPHVTLWTAQGVPPKEANTLPSLLVNGKAVRVELDPPATVCGSLEFF